MYRVGQKIVYGVHGVCTIVDLEEKRIDRKTIGYFVLEPVDHPGSRYYLPSQNPAALAKSRPLCTKEELTEILAAPVPENTWIQDENRRKQYYRELLSSVDIRAMITMFRCLQLHRQAQVEQGRKFHLCDESFLRDVQRILNAEIGLVLQISADQVEQLLQAKIT
jgi:CarD family transcriptional regulator